MDYPVQKVNRASDGNTTLIVKLKIKKFTKGLFHTPV